MRVRRSGSISLWVQRRAWGSGGAGKGPQDALSARNMQRAGSTSEKFGASGSYLAERDPRADFGSHSLKPDDLRGAHGFSN